MAEAGLTVAVTGPTGTFGFGLIPLLEADERVGRVVGIARRPFDPSEHGWNKMEYRRGDVRDAAALQEAFEGADVVVHLAFMITGAASRQTIRAINVEGTLNAFRAAVACRVERFVYASSVAAYGFHPDNPIGMTEDWPTRPASRLVLPPGEGGARGPSAGGGCQGPAVRRRRQIQIPPCGRPVPVAPADRARAPRGRCEQPPPRAAGGARSERARFREPAADPRARPGPRPAHAVHPRGRRGTGAPGLRARRGPSRGLQHRGRWNRDRGRRRPRARLHTDHRARRHRGARRSSSRVRSAPVVR